MAKWTGKSKGGSIGYSIFLYTLKWFGVWFAYFLLHFVYPFYFLFSKAAKDSLVQFYQDIGKSKKEARKLTFKNFKLLGQCLIDRIAFLSGRGKFYSFAMDGEEHLVAIESGGKGGILLSAHFGNWEIAGNLLKLREINPVVNVVMLDAEHEKIKHVIEKQTKGAKFNIIPIKPNDFSFLIEMKQALERNELICMLADRYIEGSKTVGKEFFGKKVKLPAGPFELGQMLKVPVSIVFSFKTSTKKYQLTATELIENASADALSDLYISTLEKRVEENPEQWFNYFDYFEHDTSN